MAKPLMHNPEAASPIIKPPITHLLESAQLLTAIKLLCQSTKAIQHHRGATMAWLSGEESYSTSIKLLQSDIQKIFNLIKHIQKTHPYTITEADLDNMTSNWNSILIGWTRDSVMQNFEFHCHLVEVLKRALRHCDKALIERLPHSHHNNELTSLLFNNLYDHIESLARLRGLSTNAAIIKACGQDSKAKLSYLLKDIPKQQQEIITYSQKLVPNFDVSPIFQLIESNEKDLRRLLFSIQIQILESSEINMDSYSLFQLATDIIQNQWHCLGQGIHLVDQFIFDDLII
jgi:hypothetical protein